MLEFLSLTTENYNIDLSTTKPSFKMVNPKQLKSFIFELSKEHKMVCAINLLEDSQTLKVIFPTPTNLRRCLPFSKLQFKSKLAIKLR